MSEIILHNQHKTGLNPEKDIKHSCVCSLKNESEWLNTEKAAHYLGISERTLFNLTSNGQVPYHKFGRRNRYKLDDLRNLLSAQPRGGFYGNQV